MVKLNFRIFIPGLVILVILLLLSCTNSGKEDRPEPIKEPPVDFLSAAPLIDGKLDDSLQQLPVRHFRFLEKSQTENPVVEPTFRLAYGTDFFYLFIEVAVDSIIYRDRGYQNGDGFHLAFAIPDSGSRETNEFYVLAFSPRPDSRRTWQRKFVWYRNRELSFRRLKNTRFETKVKNGKIAFEVLIPWSEFYPYHPWHLPRMGFNLCYVQAIGGNEKNYYYLVEDPRMQSEQSSRRYSELAFRPPLASDRGAPLYAILERNHFPSGQKVNLKVALLSPRNAHLKLAFLILGETGAVLRSGTFSLLASSGLSRRTLPLPTAALPPGDYRLRLIAFQGRELPDIPFTVLPAVDVIRLKKRLEQVQNCLSPGGYTTLLFRWQEIRKKISTLKPYDTAGALKKAIEDLLFLLKEAENGRDVLAEKTGLLRRAYRSRADSSLQPYTVRIPPDVHSGKRFPLLVFLHGSGTNDRRALMAWRNKLPEPFIELAPFGRGTSNAFSTGLAQQDIQEAMDDVIAHYPVDTSRIVLVGFSMGGYGVYRTFWQHPGRFGALAVFSGHPNLANRWGIPGRHPDFLQPENLTVFRGVPIFIFHGMQDRNCPFELTERLVAGLKQAGARVTFYFAENKGHEFPGREVLQRYYRWLEGVTRTP